LAATVKGVVALAIKFDSDGLITNPPDCAGSYKAVAIYSFVPKSNKNPPLVNAVESDAELGSADVFMVKPCGNLYKKFPVPPPGAPLKVVVTETCNNPAPTHA
jgi:hypothetical protein